MKLQKIKWPKPEKTASEVWAYERYKAEHLHDMQEIRELPVAKVLLVSLLIVLGALMTFLAIYAG